jgi:uncharacterized glyoxalase superfamily protein PhnB
MPARLSTITPYLTCRDAQDAIGWYQQAFGAELVGEVFPMSDTDDRVGHAELRIGESTIFLSDEWPEGGVYAPATTGHSTAGFVLYVPDVDRAFDHAVGLGATAVRPVADQFHGSRSGWLLDPFGHRWNLSTALPDPDAGPPAGRPFRAEDLYDEIGYYVLGRPDLDRAEAFYGAVFGWKFAEENPTPGGHRGAHVTSSKVPFGLTDDPGVGTMQAWIRVTDLEATLDRIRAAGGEVLDQEVYASGGNARCRDDQGVEFELYQPNPGY